MADGTSARRRKHALRFWVSLGVVLLGLPLLLALAANALVKGPVRRRLERALARPGSQVRIGRLTYALGANRLVAQAVTFQNGSASLKVKRVALTGIKWLRLVRGGTLAESLPQARLQATEIVVDWPKARYGFHCALLEASVPEAVLRVHDAALRPLVEDRSFFKDTPYRTTRWRVTVPEVTASGLGFLGILAGSACRVEAVRVVRPDLELLVDRYQAVGPLVRSPLMVNEALASLGRPFQLERLEITGGRVHYGECRVAGEPPGVLTFTEANLLAEGLANPGPGLVRLHAQAKLMDAGLLAFTLDIPLRPTGCAFHYEGSLGEMALPRLDAFLDRAERTRLLSGWADRVAFAVSVDQGRAHGRVQATYQDLKLAMLDQATDTEKGLKNRMATLFANTFRIRPRNPPGGPAPAKEGQVAYVRKPEDTFLQMLWYSLRSGILDVIKR